MEKANTKSHNVCQRRSLMWPPTSIETPRRILFLDYEQPLVLVSFCAALLRRVGHGGPSP